MLTFIGMEKTPENLETIKKNSGNRGGGRKKGTLNKKTREIAEKAVQSGITPLEVMLAGMKHAYEQSEKETGDEREKAKWLATAIGHAESAAPYIHAKLQAVNAQGSSEITVNVESKQASEAVFSHLKQKVAYEIAQQGGVKVKK